MCLEKSFVFSDVFLHWCIRPSWQTTLVSVWHAEALSNVHMVNISAKQRKSSVPCWGECPYCASVWCTPVVREEVLNFCAVEQVSKNFLTINIVLVSPLSWKTRQ